VNLSHNSDPASIFQLYLLILSIQENHPGCSGNTTLLLSGEEDMAN
jgi:hypothetical protein